MKTKEVPYEVVMAMSTLYGVCEDHPNCTDCPFCYDSNCYLQNYPCEWGFRVITKKVGEIGGVKIIKLTRISTDHYNGQSPCRRCNPSGSYSGYRNWACMMIEFKEIEGHYCPECAKEIEAEYLKEGDQNAN